MKQDVNFLTFEAAQIRRSTTTCSSFSRNVVERSPSSWKLILKSFSCNPSGQGGVVRSELFSASSSLDDFLSCVNKQPISDVHCVGRASKRKKGRETHSFSAFFNQLTVTRNVVYFNFILNRRSRAHVGHFLSKSSGS